MPSPAWVSKLRTWDSPRTPGTRRAALPKNEKSITSRLQRAPIGKLHLEQYVFCCLRLCRIDSVPAPYTYFEQLGGLCLLESLMQVNADYIEQSISKVYGLVNSPG